MFKDKIYCGLDIGSHRIKAAVIKSQENSEEEVLGIYENKTCGFKNGSVQDLSELSECIHQSVSELSKKAGVKIKEIQLGVGPELINARQTKTEIPLIDRGHKTIIQRDLKKVNTHARLLGTKMEEEILHDLPQHYLVDDTNSALNPLGLYGRKLAVNSILIIANSNHVANLSKAVHQAGFEIASTRFSSFAAKEVVLNPDELNQGCILVDIGSTTTNLLCFQNNVLKQFHKIERGGDHFTQSISNRLKLSYDLAEEIKKSYAMAQASERHHEEEILVKKEDQYISIKKQDIF